MKRASLFIPCSVNHLLPGIGDATRALLERLGVSTLYHDTQTCCGQMVYNNGFQDEARTFARHFIEVFENDEVIVCPSGSCTAMVKHTYPKLLGADPAWKARAEALSAKVFELSEFIVDGLKVTDTGSEYHGKVAYHESCHLNRGLGVSSQPKTLISTTTGTELVFLNNADQCCGFGGTFSLDYSDISGAILEAKVNAFISSGADLLIAGEPGCLLNINGFLKRHHPGKRAVHIAEFLAGTEVSHGR